MPKNYFRNSVKPNVSEEDFEWVGSRCVHEVNKLFVVVGNCLSYDSLPRQMPNLLKIVH